MNDVAGLAAVLMREVEAPVGGRVSFASDEHEPYRVTMTLARGGRACTIPMHNHLARNVHEVKAEANYLIVKRLREWDRDMAHLAASAHSEA